MLSTSFRLPLVWLALIAAACTTDTQSHLAGALLSGMGPAEAAAALNVNEASLQLIWETKLAPDDKRPPYSEKTLKGRDLSCLGVRADLKLNFYLDQLTSVVCYVKDSRELLSALKSAGIVDDDSEVFEVSRGDVRISGRRESDLWAVTFTSKSLDTKQRAWLARYS